MCTVMLAAAVGQFALGAASGVMGYQGQKQQYEAQQQTYKNNRTEANRAAVDSYASTQNRQLQERKAASQEAQELAVEGVKSRSTATVAAGEAGVTGLSVDALIGDYYGQQGRYQRTLETNHQMQSDYLQGEMKSTESTTAGRINSVDQGQKPSYTDAAIRILGSGLDAFGSYQSNKR